MIDPGFCQVTTTTDSREAAELLARGAVRARLAACGQVTGPITSTYWWEDRVESSEEWMVWFKTTMRRYPDLERYIGEHHAYDVPEIICSPLTAGSQAYLDWIARETG